MDLYFPKLQLGKPEVQRGEVPCSGTCKKSVAEMGIEPRSLSSESCTTFLEVSFHKVR